MIPTSADATASVTDLQNQLDSLTRNQDSMTSHLQGLSQQYQSFFSKINVLQKTLTSHDSVMQNIIQYLVNPDIRGISSGVRENPFLPGDQAQKLISSYDEAARASVDIMNDLSQLGASLAPSVLANPQGVPPSAIQHTPHLQPSQAYNSPSYSSKSEHVKSETHTPSRDGFTSTATSPDSHSARAIPANILQQQVVDRDGSADDYEGYGNFLQYSNDQHSVDGQGGLRVFTVGHLAPRQDDDPTHDTPGPQPPPNLHIVKDHENRQPHALRVRRQTFVPGWSVPPKILLVDDDAVYRNMSSKFLQVFGCEADVAVDGFSALDKVNMEKYDLILMDVVMPNLDGVSATNMIRQFDVATPIISMTSNIRSSDIMQYFNSGIFPIPSLRTWILIAGMNDVLPKPFTKDSLLGMLEKHLLHMKEMQQMQETNFSIPQPISNTNRIVPIDSNPPQDSSPHAAEDPLTSPTVQFPYEQDYSGIFTPSDANGIPQQYPAAVPPPTGKRRTASEHDYEYVDPHRAVPRSSGETTHPPGKRARYNTPPW